MRAKQPLIVAMFLLVPAFLAPPAFAQGPAGSSDKPSRIVPRQTEEILANPDVGWETFCRSGRQDRNLPPWVPSTVYYVRWGWGQMEPRPGQIDFGLVDRALQEARGAGQKMAFRVMCCSTSRNEPYHPDWLKAAGGKELAAEFDGSTFPVPDLDDPATLERHLDFIGRLGKRYDGHPGISHVDLGSIGWWGEWHMTGSPKNKMPALQNRKKVVDAYFAAFKQTPLLMLIGGGPNLKYAARRGAGWRADCLGDLGMFAPNWNHMRDSYPASIRDGGVRETWKTSPVAWETCGDMRDWVKKGWSLRHIFNYALALHASYINNKSEPLPPGAETRSELERFLRRLGHRLVLNELQHPSSARPGEKLGLVMKWQNIGSAPCYKPYRLAYRLRDERGRGRVFVSRVTVDRWLPGSIDLFTKEFFDGPKDLPPGKIHTISDSIILPADVSRGKLELSLGVVDESSRPVVRLGISGRASDGWYPLGKILVVR